MALAELDRHPARAELDDREDEIVEAIGRAEKINEIAVDVGQVIALLRNIERHRSALHSDMGGLRR